MATFYFKAVAGDGRTRTGTLHGETEREIARELMRQGLTPVYVGSQRKQQMELRLPQWGAPGRKDVLFFTQELSTLLNAGVPLDRALAITAELTEKSQFRFLVNDILRRASQAVLRTLCEYGARRGGQRVFGPDLSATGFVRREPR